MSEKLVKKRISVTLTKPYLDAMERLVREGVYTSRAQLIKDALRRLFRHYGIEPFGVEETEKTRGKYVVITATLVPEAEGVERSRLEREIREEVEKITIPWVKEILKVTISNYLFQED